MTAAVSPRPRRRPPAAPVGEPEGPRRRRRTREEARLEILAAVEELLAERTYDALSVAAVMSRTTLSRKSFYVYFRDVPDALRAMIRPIQDELEAILAEGTAHPARMGRLAFVDTARVFVRHGNAIRALYEASQRDGEAQALWHDLVSPAWDMLAQSIRDGMAAGRITRLDPEATARALIGLNHRTFFEQLAGRPEADVERVVAPLVRIWTRTLYRADPEDLGWTAGA